ncbi:HAD family hydrolase [candidate division KSB1 bacterium]|nr:MAG: HAD family hydrolase [candidate division KSB1 bacterium]
MKLLIFDIDGTLTHLDGATRRAFDAAYLRVFGVHAVTDTLKLHGRTDPLIFRDCFGMSGLTGDWEQAYQTFRSAYLEALPGCISASKKIHLHPGIAELLNELDKRRDLAALALGTGNMEAGARIKIGQFGLNRYFPAGGFGDTHHDRADILRDAVRSAETHYNRAFEKSDTWVIGDTIHDIEGGQAVGLRTMGVATGGAFTRDDLVAAHADVVFDNLSETKTVIRAFGMD